MHLRSLNDISKLKGKRMLVRVDFNVPFTAKGTISFASDERMTAALPTIQFLRKKKARVILVAHLGEPTGRDPHYSLAPVAHHLSKLLGRPVIFIADHFDDGTKVDQKIAALRDGDVALLENIRFYRGEEENSPFLSRRLASFADLFVNDAFGAAHRAHASTVGVAKVLPSYAGLLMTREVATLDRLFDKPKHPFVVLLGGAKISTKIAALKRLVDVADYILLGGGMANNFFRAQGYRIGESLCARNEIKLAEKLLRHKNIFLPFDVIVSATLDERARTRVTEPCAIKSHERIVDIGPQTTRYYEVLLSTAKTIVWNGPVGMCEYKKFAEGSLTLGRTIAERGVGSVFTVVGGGDTIACLHQIKMAHLIDHVSTGGGAMLAFLGGEKLPALTVLQP